MYVSVIFVFIQCYICVKKTSRRLSLADVLVFEYDPISTKFSKTFTHVAALGRPLVTICQLGDARCYPLSLAFQIPCE